MLTDLFISILTPFVNVLSSFLPSTTSCSLTGLSSAGSFFGSIYATTVDFVPWSDMFLMFAIVLAIGGVRILMQVVNFLWP